MGSGFGKNPWRARPSSSSFGGRQWFAEYKNARRPYLRALRTCSRHQENGTIDTNLVPLSSGPRDCPCHTDKSDLQGTIKGGRAAASPRWDHRIAHHKGALPHLQSPLPCSARPGQPKRGAGIAVILDAPHLCAAPVSCSCGHTALYSGISAAQGLPQVGR